MNARARLGQQRLQQRRATPRAPTTPARSFICHTVNGFNRFLGSSHSGSHPLR